jgi:hypothetical protein
MGGFSVCIIIGGLTMNLIIAMVSGVIAIVIPVIIALHHYYKTKRPMLKWMP